MSRPLAILTVSVLFLPSVHADELRLSAKQLYDRGVCVGLRLNADGALELERGTLSEGDGPAAGFSYKPNEEKLSATTWIKKELDVRDGAKKATLLVAPGGKLDAIINGKAIALTNPIKVGSYWQGYDIPPDLLKAGKNEIILSGAGKVWIARDEDYAQGSKTITQHPNKSAKSSDAGKTWDYDKLGTGNNIDGEYYVRLALDQYVSRGSIEGLLLDSANPTGIPLPAPIESVGPIQVKVVGDAGPAGAFSMRVGTGSTPDIRTWKDWKVVEGNEVALPKPAGRYVHINVEANTKDARHTPRIREIVVSAEHRRAADWTTKINVAKVQNGDLLPAIAAFPHQKPDHPKLKELRDRFKLDEIVKGAKDDVEIMGKLAGWASKQFAKMHLRDEYPAWDALEILKPHADGTPVGGFCQQYNVVLLQACQSLGLIGRAVSIGPGDHGEKIRSGHEVVEIWSNDHKKWVYIDGQKAWHMIDDKSGAPLSLLELHERQMATLSGKNPPGVRVVKWSESAPEWGGLESFPPFIELRLIPRSNFLDEQTPLPLNQGMRGWFWTGHHVWGGVPQNSSLIYSQFVRNPAQWNWTMNQAHLILEPLPTPGEIRVHALTDAVANFESLQVRIDGGDKQNAKESTFLWKLHAGDNRLEVTPISKGGRAGVASWVSVTQP